MSNQHIPVSSDIPSPVEGRRKRFSPLLSRTGLAAMAAGVGLAAALVGGGTAYADTLTNGPTISLGDYTIPTTAPAYNPNAAVIATEDGNLFNPLSTTNGVLGNPAIIGMTGSATDDTANTYVASIPGGSSAWGTQTATSVYSSGSANQVWYFQRVGWIGLNTPLSEEFSTPGQDPFGPVELAAPVYRILNYNNGTYTCLDAYGGSGAAGSIVDSYGCDPNQVNQTNQLWVVSSPALANDEIEVPSGTFVDSDGEMSQLGQTFTDSLQNSDSSLSPGLEDSVIENVASLAANGWDTATAPVLSATYTDVQGTNSGLDLQDQTWPADNANSTWNILAENLPSTSGSGGSGGSSCTGFAVLMDCA
jgi:hypothetical protein